MTNVNNHGGARRKVRDDDRRGKHHSPKPGSGRQPTTFTVKLGDKFFVGRNDQDGNGVLPSELWRVAEITRTHVLFASDNGDTVKLLR